jgi:hypothetical protein
MEKTDKQPTRRIFRATGLGTFAQKVEMVGVEPIAKAPTKPEKAK